jgi:DivIVA domain-containing protein
MLTAADVEQKTFSTALRGYDLDEVDDFLDEIVATIRQLTEQLEEARVAAVEAPPVMAPAPEPEPATVVEPELDAVVEPEPEPEPAGEVPQPEIDESAIGRALIAAQTAADRLLEDAKANADRIVEEAKTEADGWTVEREAKRREAEAEIARLTTRIASVRSELSLLAGEVSQSLDEMDSVVREAATSEGIDGDREADAASDAPGEYGDPSEGEVWGETEEGSDHGQGTDESTERSDHLDAMLTGVVNDLQLSSEEPESRDEHEHRENDDYDEDE